MKITPAKDFLYSLDGINASTFQKGVEAVIPDEKYDYFVSIGYVASVEKEVITKEKVFIPQSLSDIEGLKKANIAKLALAGITTIEELRKMTIEQLSSIDGISERMATKILENLK